MVNCNSKIDGMGKPQTNLREYHSLEACNYEELHSNTVVFNKALFGPTVHVKVRREVQHSCRLLAVYESHTRCSVPTYTFDGLDSPWVDIPVDCLDLDIGLHTYTLEFVNMYTGDTYYQYFDYILQSDSPDKPYIYMER